jgi:hypothetical protein
MPSYFLVELILNIFKILVLKNILQSEFECTDNLIKFIENYRI